MSHSEDVALIALSPDVPLGVDVEAIRPLPDLLDIASRNFTSAETEVIASAPPDERDLAFFLCWTRKEAFVKATGAGIFRQPLQSFAVSVDPGAGPVRLEIPGHDAEAGRWRLVSLDAGPGYAAAVAAEGAFHVRRYRWDG